MQNFWATSVSAGPNRDPYRVQAGWIQWSQTHIQTAAHIPEIGGSSPPPTTKNPLKSYDFSGFLYYFSARFIFVSAV